MVREQILKELENIIGIDYKYEDLYLEIELEIDKLSGVTQESIDFNFILNNCENLLINKTKDFKLASWWFYSNFKINGIEGILYAIDCYIEFIEKYYLSFYPKTKKSQTNIIEWIENILQRDIENSEVLKKEIKGNIVLNESFIKLSEAFSKINTEKLNYFKTLQELTKKNILEIVEEKEEIIENPIKEEKTDDLSEINQIQEKYEFEIIDDFSANKALKELKKDSSKLLEYYKENSFLDKKIFRINRFISWLEIDDLPMTNGKKSSIYPPSIEDLEQIENLHKQQDYKKLINLSEDILKDCPFWLDGHYYSYQSLKSLNLKKEANEIKNALLYFLKTNDGLLNITFIDETPFASAKTKTWIEKEVNNNTKIEEKSIETSNDSLDFFAKIDNLIDDNNIKEAMKLFELEIQSTLNMEDKFNLKLRFAQISIENSKKDIGKIFLEELLKDIKYFKLEKWNSKLCSNVYSLILNNFTKYEFEEDKLQNLFSKLCKIDINKAYEINLN